MLEDAFRELEEKMKKVVESGRRQFATLRTCRTLPNSLTQLPVEAYGATVPLGQLANISAPEQRLIVIHPFDASTMKAIEKAIQNSDLGLSPRDDGRMIRLAIPPMPLERRKELVKQLNMMTEQHRVALRNCRREFHDRLREFESSKVIDEAAMRGALDRTQLLVANYTRELDVASCEKSTEIMEV